MTKTYVVTIGIEVNTDNVTLADVLDEMETTPVHLWHLTSEDVDFHINPCIDVSKHEEE